MESSVPTATMEEATAAMDLGPEMTVESSETLPKSSDDDGDQTMGDTPNDNDDNIDDGDDSTTEEEIMPEDDNDEDKAVSPEQADVLLLKAMGLKEEGNTEFKEGNLEKASRAYRRSVNVLKKLNQRNSGDAQVKSLLVTLYTNLSTVSFKHSKYRVSIEVATKALHIEPHNVKALYRRAVAHRQLGNLETSRTDLRTALAADATNVACKKELAAVKKEWDAAKENQKKALAKAFRNENGASFLYNDMQDASVKKQNEERKLQQEREAQVARHKQQWEDECVSLMAKKEPAITFEEWDKQRKDKLEEERQTKEADRKAKEADRKAQRLLEKAKKATVNTKTNDDNDDDDDDVLTESELAMMRGYKKTSDGRTTSYFTRELSSDEVNQLGDMAPKRLDNSNSATMAPEDLKSSTTSTSASVWNQAGTWEEKDTTDWCRAQLRERLLTTSVESTCATTALTTMPIVRAMVTSVEELTGDASVAVVSGKKRYIFDFHVKLKYEIVVDKNQASSALDHAAAAAAAAADTTTEDDKNAPTTVWASGVVRLPDICSTHHEELEVVFDGWTKRPKTKDREDVALAARATLANHLRTVVVPFFVQDFNNAY
jgi:tetratricopeptide (TPR) repeat protein